MKPLLTTSAGLGLALALGAGAVAAEQLGVTKLPPPPWQRFGPLAGSSRMRLTLVSSRQNGITDERAWFASNGLDLAEDRVPGPLGTDVPLHPLPQGTPTSFRGRRLIRAIRQPSRLFLVYGRDFSAGRYLVARAAGTSVYGFDFVNYAYAPRPVPGEKQFAYQAPTWAAEIAGTLLVSHSHGTYSRSSRGQNAYVTAVDLQTGKLRWRSRPLVSNAESFAVVKDAIVTGYGFTKEPDFLYVLDRRTGAVLQRLPLPSSPEYVIAKSNRVYVRTYDHDLVFRIRTA